MDGVKRATLLSWNRRRLRLKVSGRQQRGRIFMFVQNGRWSVLSLWLLDFARRYPQADQLDGLDIGFDQVPNKEWLPSNIVFSPLRRT